MQPHESPVRDVDPSDDDFADVLAAAQRGQPAALRMLYDRYARVVAGYLRARGVRDVDDLASEVFLNAFGSLGKFAGGSNDFRAWILTIAHHRWVDDQRRSARRVETTDYDPGHDDRLTGSAEDEVLDRLALERVHERLSTLAPDQRDVLVLRVVGDLTIEQIAAVLGKRVGAVKALQRRGLAALRRAMDPEGVPQ